MDTKGLTNGKSHKKKAAPGDAAPPPPAPYGPEVIGRKLRVRWPNGAWYSGVVKSFEDGVHTIQYADGDVERFPGEDTGPLHTEAVKWQEAPGPGGAPVVAGPPPEGMSSEDWEVIKRAALGVRVKDRPSESGPRPYGPEVVGRRVEIYWPSDDAWYKGTVTRYMDSNAVHRVVYDDGDAESFPSERTRALHLERIRWLAKARPQGGGAGQGVKAGAAGVVKVKRKAEEGEGGEEERGATHAKAGPSGRAGAAQGLTPAVKPCPAPQQVKRPALNGRLAGASTPRVEEKGKGQILEDIDTTDASSGEEDAGPRGGAGAGTTRAAVRWVGSGSEANGRPGPAKPGRQPPTPPPPIESFRTATVSELRAKKKEDGRKTRANDLIVEWRGWRTVRKHVVTSQQDGRGGGRGLQRKEQDELRRLAQGGPDSAGPFKRVIFCRSAVHAYGVMAAEPIAEGEAVVQYVGQLIRRPLADLRERAYVAAGLDSSYLFAVNHEYVVDATFCGSMARYLNHSCDPNCRTERHGDGLSGRIYIKAKRAILPGEELTYDYKFSLEDDGSKVQCLCGAQFCRGYMN